MTSTTPSPAHKLPITWLFTPGTAAAHFDDAGRAGAGVAILDLEDAVALADKDRARDLVLNYLASHQGESGDVRYAVRINSPNSIAGLRDLLAITDRRVTPDYIVVPKVCAANAIDLIAEVLAAADMVSDIVVMIETASAARMITSIVQETHCPIAAIMYGAADMAADLGAEPAGTVVQHARSTVLAAAASAEIPVIDSPWFDISDAIGLADSVADAVGSGFSAKAAVHPGQISTIVDGFAPTEDQIDWARMVVETSARGIGTVGGHMIDEAIARRARQILARAKI